MRILAVFLIAAVCHAQDFFPPGAFSERQEIQRFLSSWYSSQLKSLKEVPLFSLKPNKDAECYRFTWLRTFHRPVVFRVDAERGDVATLTIRVADGAGGYEPGKLVRDDKKAFDQQSLKRLRGTVRHSNFFTLPSYEASRGLDGSEWMVEVVFEGRYHVVSRWSPRDGPVREIGLQLIEVAIGEDLVPIH